MTGRSMRTGELQNEARLGKIKSASAVLPKLILFFKRNLPIPESHPDLTVHSEDSVFCILSYRCRERSADVWSQYRFAGSHPS